MFSLYWSKLSHRQTTLTNALALPIFSSDAISSVAYATGEMLTVLAVAGAAGFACCLPITVMIVALIAIVGFSYKQAIAAYPCNGGAYVVSRENLGPVIAIVAASALFIDYVLTVAVSASAGVLAVVSAAPLLQAHAVALTVCLILVITWLNLRGVKESAKAFALPTYAFIGFVFLLFLVAGVQAVSGHLHPLAYQPHQLLVTQGSALGLTLILRAFSSGCSAMTGIEAVSNGVSAFKAPASRNASRVLTYLISLLAVMFLGVSLLAYSLHVKPIHGVSVIAQIAQAVFGNGFFFEAFQVSTFAILLVAANTAFAGFPRLLAQVSQDGFLPKRLADLSSRLTLHNGIRLLACIAVFLVLITAANLNHLIALYSLGVFIAFTLCQMGLVKYWWCRRAKVAHCYRKICINGLGAICTFVVVLVVLESKFTEGAWSLILLLPLMVGGCLLFKRRKYNAN